MNGFLYDSYGQKPIFHGVTLSILNSPYGLEGTREASKRTSEYVDVCQASVPPVHPVKPICTVDRQFKHFLKVDNDPAGDPRSRRVPAGVNAFVARLNFGYSAVWF